ncbi:MAG: EF-hand domain-containing protein [Allosphingosinicella sp.]
MLRIVGGAASALALLLAGFFIWKGRASAESQVPRPPSAAVASAYVPQGGSGRRALSLPPSASEKSKEEKRFARADRNDDGRVLLAELLEPRRKAFAKLDRDGNGQLSFDEWAARTEAKFAEADNDRSGWLDSSEFAATAPKRKPKPARCACG